MRFGGPDGKSAVKKIILAGAGAHCKVILDILRECGGYEPIGILDGCREKMVLGAPVIGTDDMLPEIYHIGVRYGFAAIGNNHIREQVSKKMVEIGFELAALISPHAVISRYAETGAGTAVMPGAVINACARIGDGCIINTNCSVDHDCEIGDFVHIAPGCAISGTVRIGRGSFLGTGVRVIDQIKIGERVMVGAGAVVIQDLPDGCTAVGVPARIIKKEGS